MIGMKGWSIANLPTKFGASVGDILHEDTLKGDSIASLTKAITSGTGKQKRLPMV
jgi:hypothetical protein